MFIHDATYKYKSLNEMRLFEGSLMKAPELEKICNFSKPWYVIEHNGHVDIVPKS